jgi:DNA replication ATP-dependent helicase Dna2
MEVSKPTKSFFDQDHNQKVMVVSLPCTLVSDETKQPRPGQWHRPQNRTPLSETSSNVAAHKPPIPATSQAKSKLRAFQFAEEAPSENRDEAEAKEAGAVNETSSSAPVVAEKTVSENAAVDASQAPPQLPHAQTFPSTPGTKLPLEDLIGNFEESTAKVETNEVSPEEHIGWIPNSSSNLLTPNRKRKRARSSSPSCPNTSSQRQEASLFFAGTAAQADTTTPEADPAADLWQRYAAARQPDDALKLPNLGEIAFQGSPRSLETPAKNTVFRRWASTGNDWPSSKNKRRRTHGKTSIGVWQADQATEPGIKSKVAAMVDKLQESLASQNLANPPAKPIVRIDGPSSSSPLPETGAADSFNAVSAESPLQSRHSNVNAKPSLPFGEIDGPEAPKQPGHSGQERKLNNGDARMNQAIEPMISAPLHLQSKAPLPANKRPSITRTPSANLQQRTNAPAAAPNTVTSDLDEFGDELDLTAEDLDEIMTQPPPLHQRPLHQIPAHPDPPPPQQLSIGEPRPPQNIIDQTGQACQPIHIDDFDDDEFGCGDIDEAALVQVEINATQAFRASLSKSHQQHL